MVNVAIRDEVAVPCLRKVVEVADVTLPMEGGRRLQLDRPDRVVGPGVREGHLIDGTERQDCRAEDIAVCPYRVEVAVPPRVHHDVPKWVEDRLVVLVQQRVAVGIVGILEDIASVVEHDVQDHQQPEAVCFVHEIAQILTGAEARLNVQEILRRVAMIVVSRHKLRMLLVEGSGHLFEDRADPQGSYPHPLYIAKLSPQIPECAAAEFLPICQPGVYRNRIRISRELEQRRQATRDWVAVVIEVGVAMGTSSIGAGATLGPV